MPKPELTEEEVFENDKDPLEAIREIRREEGVAEEDLPISDSDDSSKEGQAAAPADGDDELDNLDKDKDKDKDDDKAADDADADDKGADPDADPGDEDQDLDDKDPDADEDPADKDGKPDEDPADKAVKEPMKFKANGQEFEFSESEIMEQFEVVFGQAMNYTQKMQAMAPYRKMISALETESITAEQLNTAIDAMKGNKQALQKLIEDNKLDAYDLTDEGAGERDPYTPTEYGKNDVQLGIDDVAKEISSDPEYKITVDVIDNQWDSTSRQSFASNPELIKGLHNDIKTGTYDKVAPVAMKMKVLDGNTKSDIEYYMLAGEKVMAAEQQSSADAEKTVADMNKKAQGAEKDFDQASSEAQNKRSASNTRKRADRKGVTDYLDDDDENFDAWYKNLMASN